jgi:nitric oxide reductase large subunit
VVRSVGTKIRFTLTGKRWRPSGSSGRTGADTLVFTAAQANAFNALQSYYHTFFAEPSTKYGLRSGAITGPTDTRNLTAFFAWSAPFHQHGFLEILGGTPVGRRLS